jgi:hypothetical protein
MSTSTMFEDQTVELLPARTTMKHFSSGGRGRGRSGGGGIVIINIQIGDGNVFQTGNINAR